MKIIHIIGDFVIGGAEVFTKELAIEQKTLGHDIEVWALGSNKDKESQEYFEQEFKKNNIKYRIFDKKYGRDKIRIILEIRKALKESKPQIVNAHMERIALLCMPACIFMKLKLIQILHSTNIEFPFFQKIFYKYGFSQNIAISKEVSEAYIDVCGSKSEKLTTILNGININNFKCDRKINDTVNQIIAVGRLEKEKNHGMIIETYNILNKKKVNLPLLKIVGEGSKKNEYQKKIAEYNLDEKIKLLGARMDINNLLFESDIYLLPSIWEGLSISLIEAATTGIPIIASDVGSNSTIIENGVSGILMQNNTSEELAKSIMLYIEDYNLRVNASKNVRKKANEFTIEKTAQEYIGLYYRLVNEK